MSLQLGLERGKGLRSISRGPIAWTVCTLFASIMLSVMAFGQAAPAKAPKTGYYVDPAEIHLLHLLPVPPAEGSPVNKDEFATLHGIESARTPAQIAAAKVDDGEEDIFSYRTVFGELGDAFKAESLPLTAKLSVRVHGEQSAATADLKPTFARPRPYQVDKTLHPVCAVTEVHNSYPSGHTLSGYLLAFTLAEMVPEKKEQILARADDYAHNRLVCGVHYPSDLEASRRVAFAVFGAMMASPKFRDDMAAAAAEIQAKLGTGSVSK